MRNRFYSAHDASWVNFEAINLHITICNIVSPTFSYDKSQCACSFNLYFTLCKNRVAYVPDQRYGSGPDRITVFRKLQGFLQVHDIFFMN